MIEKMNALLREKDSCVLATVSNGKPHCSLMSYIADRQCREIYMMTYSKTKMYKNLLENPRVSLLIDTRQEGRGIAIGQIKALTVSRVFPKIDPAEGKKVRTQFLTRHPQLEDLVKDLEKKIISIPIQSFQLLEGIRIPIVPKQIEPTGQRGKFSNN